VDLKLAKITQNGMQVQLQLRESTVMRETKIGSIGTIGYTQTVKWLSTKR